MSRSPVRIRTAATIVALCAAVTGLAACGSDDTGKSVTVGGVTLDHAPERIVSLSPTSTEMLFAIGAGDQVVAVDKYSNYPKGVPSETIDAYQLNVEAVTAFEPDLVILAGDTNKAKAALEKLAIPVLIEPAAEKLGDAYAQMRGLGRITGHADEAEKLVDQVSTEIKEITSAASVEPLTYYYELDQTYYSATSGTFIGQLLGLLGLHNIADAAEKDSPYPQLSPEYILEQDPDLILLADTKCCGQTAASVAKRAGWSGMKAVANDAVVPLDDDIASRWGPRVTVLLQQVADAVARVSQRSMAGAH